MLRFFLKFFLVLNYSLGYCTSLHYVSDFKFSAYFSTLCLILFKIYTKHCCHEFHFDTSYNLFIFSTGSVILIAKSNNCFHTYYMYFFNILLSICFTKFLCDTISFNEFVHFGNKHLEP